MPKRIQADDGRVHEFPDDATDDDISQALNGASAGPQKMTGFEGRDSQASAQPPSMPDTSSPDLASQLHVNRPKPAADLNEYPQNGLERFATAAGAAATDEIPDAEHRAKNRQSAMKHVSDLVHPKNLWDANNLKDASVESGRDIGNTLSSLNPIPAVKDAVEGILDDPASGFGRLAPAAGAAIIAHKLFKRSPTPKETMGRLLKATGENAPETATHLETASPVFEKTKASGNAPKKLSEMPDYLEGESRSIDKTLDDAMAERSKTKSPKGLLNAAPVDITTGTQKVVGEGKGGVYRAEKAGIPDSQFTPEARIKRGDSGLSPVRLTDAAGPEEGFNYYTEGQQPHEELSGHLTNPATMSTRDPATIARTRQRLESVMSRPDFSSLPEGEQAAYREQLAKLKDVTDAPHIKYEPHPINEHTSRIRQGILDDLHNFPENAEGDILAKKSTIKAIQTLADEIGSINSLEELDKMRVRLNGELDAYLGKNPAAKATINRDPARGFKTRALEAIRDAEAELIANENMSKTDVRGARTQQSALMKLHKIFTDATKKSSANDLGESQSSQGFGPLGKLYKTYAEGHEFAFRPEKRAGKMLQTAKSENRFVKKAFEKQGRSGRGGIDTFAAIVTANKGKKPEPEHSGPHVRKDFKPPKDNE